MLSEVPDEWTVDPLSKLLQPSLFIDGDWVESKDQSLDGDVRLIQLADIGDGYFIDKSDRHLTKDAAYRLKCTFLKKGDLLIARMPDPLGRCCVFPLDGEERFVTVVDVAVMRPHESFNATWLMNLINSGYARRFIEDKAGGTTRKRISRKNLGGLPLPVPPLNEQHRIAEILSSVDASIQATQAVIEQAERVKRGLMEELLTGGLGGEAIERGEVPEGWRLLPLGDFAKIKNGFAFKSEEFLSDDGADGDVSLVVRMSDFNGGYVDTSHCKRVQKTTAEGLEKFRLKQGDILVAMSGATVGKLGRVPATSSELYLNQRVGCMQPTQCRGEFLWQLVNTPFFQATVLAAATGNAQPNISSKELEKILFALPPDSVQHRIVGVLTAFDDFIVKQRKIVEQQNRTKKGLMDDLLTGKVRTV